MYCKNCNEHMCGDGYLTPYQCPNNETEYYQEPDANPVYCTTNYETEYYQEPDANPVYCTTNHATLEPKMRSKKQAPCSWDELRKNIKCSSGQPPKITYRTSKWGEPGVSALKSYEKKVNSNGKPHYRWMVNLGGTLYEAKRIMWFYHTKEWPTGNILNINKNRNDFNIKNLYCPSMERIVPVIESTPDESSTNPFTEYNYPRLCVWWGKQLTIYHYQLTQGHIEVYGKDYAVVDRDITPEVYDLLVVATSLQIINKNKKLHGGAISYCK